MEGFVAQKLDDYATGKISRRGLIEMLTLAESTAYAGTANAGAKKFPYRLDSVASSIGILNWRQ